MESWWFGREGLKNIYSKSQKKSLYCQHRSILMWCNFLAKRHVPNQPPHSPLLLPALLSSWDFKELCICQNGNPIDLRWETFGNRSVGKQAVENMTAEGDSCHFSLWTGTTIIILLHNSSLLRYLYFLHYIFLCSSTPLHLDINVTPENLSIIIAFQIKIQH